MKCGARNAECGIKIKQAIFALLLLSITLLGDGSDALSNEKWQGVDETVVEKIAKEHGREAQEPLINTDKGDLLLFVFLLGGTIAGFAAGYYWRSLIEKKKE